MPNSLRTGNVVIIQAHELFQWLPRQRCPLSAPRMFFIKADSSQPGLSLQTLVPNRASYFRSSSMASGRILSNSNALCGLRTAELVW